MEGSNNVLTPDAAKKLVETIASRKISVILPFENASHDLERAIDSALKQNHKNVEIILVDKGASDSDVAQLRHLAETNSKIRLVKSQGPGIGRAYNAGLGIASGDYVAFLDACSTFMPGRLVEQIMFMENSKALFSHASYTLESDEKIFPQQLRSAHPYSAVGENFPFIAAVSQISLSTVMMSRSLFTEKGFAFPQSDSERDDLGLLFRIARQHQLFGIGKPLAVVRATAEHSAYNIKKWRDELTAVLAMVEKDTELSGFASEIEAARESMKTITYPIPLATKMRRVLDRLIAKIQAAPIDPQPSDNIYMEEVFEPDMYAEILANLPRDEDFDFIEHPDAVLPDGTKTRKLLDLTDETLERLTPGSRLFWRHLKDVVDSDSLRIAILHKFWGKMQERFGKTWPESLTVPVFYRDFAGYKIAVHPDAPYKLATLQFYLPKDDSQVHLGTSFHQRVGNRFELLKTNAFKPNSAYAFARTDYSWHSVLQMGAHEAARDTLALTVYAKGLEYKSEKRYV